MPRIPINLVVELSKIRAALKSPISSNIGMMRLEALITELENEPQKWIIEQLEQRTERWPARTGN